MYTVPGKTFKQMYCTSHLYLFYVNMRSSIFWVVTTVKSGNFIYAMVVAWNLDYVTMCTMYHTLIHSLHQLHRHILDRSTYWLNSQRHWLLKCVQVMNMHLHVVNKAFAYTKYTTANKQKTIYCLVTGFLLHSAKLLILWLFLYPLDEILYMDFDILFINK